MSDDVLLPDAYFGSAGAARKSWRLVDDDSDPDDELLAKTPADVVAMLGFDPAEEPA